MNILRSLLLLIPLTIFLIGCNANHTNEEVHNPPNNAKTEDQNLNNDQKTNNNIAQNDDNNDDFDNENEDVVPADTNQQYVFNFTEFELEVDYEGQLEYEVSYEKHQDKVEAEIEDSIKNVKYSGKDAYEKLVPIFESLDITKDSSKDDVISKVLQAFELKNDYSKFELEITFEDGTKKEYDDLPNANTSS